jgi:hypothetical protein
MTTKVWGGLAVLVVAALLWAMISPLVHLRGDQLNDPAAVGRPP